MTLLNELRERAGLTQEQVAAALDISVSTVNRHETGKTALRRMHRVMYAQHFRVKADTIEQPARDEAAA